MQQKHPRSHMGDVDEPGLTSNSLSLARIEGCVKENTLQNQLSMASQRGKQIHGQMMNLQALEALRSVYLRT
jgi:hypothetical protein